MGKRESSGFEIGVDPFLREKSLQGCFSDTLFLCLQAMGNAFTVGLSLGS